MFCIYYSLYSGIILFVPVAQVTSTPTIKVNPLPTTTIVQQQKTTNNKQHTNMRTASYDNNITTPQLLQGVIFVPVSTSNYNCTATKTNNTHHTNIHTASYDNNIPTTQLLQGVLCVPVAQYQQLQLYSNKKPPTHYIQHTYSKL